ncbi:hypothetical protein ACMV_P1_02640 (plasmid) [Acidiphilium multivorum AIU301]|uniref:Uncharacterized protein n=1 Tax=Acidiphilium multivorum (strain DSM 11245 / JCM 8867 / NBRC 100883 / AIU 301) TaxID=926570 RepID=F0J7J3_ACIMA|nr:MULTISPECIES: hypothetical protein [Acidiphilium]BAJ83060.1 hypothetical protein ACMV_P1_02640 [Acidiphilium multivorum AIU301]GAN75430.1 hypothetical protein Apmu_0359_02 [Acidiphilium multivorum AIU301]
MILSDAKSTRPEKMVMVSGLSQAKPKPREKMAARPLVPAGAFVVVQVDSCPDISAYSRHRLSLSAGCPPHTI